MGAVVSAYYTPTPVAPAAYLERGAVRRVWSRAEVVALAHELGVTVPTVVREFYLVPLERGYGSNGAIGCECRHCGAPMGSRDPDYCQWIVYSDCGCMGDI